MALIADSCSDVPAKFIAITETWLQDYIKDAPLTTEGFNIARCDRGDRVGGSVLLYSYQNYPSSEKKREKYDESYCLGLFVRLSSLKLGFFVAYHPSEAPTDKFQGVLTFFQKCMEEKLDRPFQVSLVEDFNFPDMQWHTERVLSGQSFQSQDSAHEFLRFFYSNFMNQYVDKPTPYSGSEYTGPVLYRKP